MAVVESSGIFEADKKNKSIKGMNYLCKKLSFLNNQKYGKKNYANYLVYRIFDSHHHFTFFYRREKDNIFPI